MNYVTTQILQSLRKARISKGISQRELSVLSGVPQSHISKIESGQVDLRVSSLIALARVLDVELFLAPKKFIPAIQSIMSSSNVNKNDVEEISPAYTLEEDGDD